MPSCRVLVFLIVTFRLSRHEFRENESTIQPISWCDESLTCPNAKRKNPYKNTMCEYKESMNKVPCACMVDSMTPALKDALLAMHNTFRNEIAKGDIKGWPTAADMRQLTWDDTLAESALRWAFQCKPGNDHCRVTPDYGKVAQNEGVIEHHRVYVESYEIFRLWISELKKTSPIIVDYYTPDPEYRHFSNVVWSWTTRIGCGIINHTRIAKTSKYLYAVALVCNMAPGGNIKSLQMYVKGPPCSACYRGTKCNPFSTYQYLCALPTDPSNEVPYEVPIDRRNLVYSPQPKIMSLIASILIVL